MDAAVETVGGHSPWRTARGHVVLAVLGLLCVFPIYWLYATSLRRPQDVHTLSPLPWPLSVQSYTNAASKVNIIGLLANTTLVALLTSLGQLLRGC